jgi:hypothetical protein
MKKADMVKHRKKFDHVGLLVDRPPGGPGCPSLVIRQLRFNDLTELLRPIDDSIQFLASCGKGIVIS